MSEQNGEETEKMKTCPRCGNKVLEHVTQCRKDGCNYCFPMSCAGCGREIKGRVFCRECAEHGVYHFQRASTLPPMQPLQPEEKNVRKLVHKLLNDPNNSEVGAD